MFEKAHEIIRRLHRHQHILVFKTCLKDKGLNKVGLNSHFKTVMIVCYPKRRQDH